MIAFERGPGASTFVAAVAALVAAAPFAQVETKLYKFGHLTAASRAAFAPRLAAFRRGVLEKGHREHGTVVIEKGYAGGRRERLRALTHELLALVLNLKTTAKLRIALPRSILLCADQVIE